MKIYSTAEWRRVRQFVLNRDNWRCKRCGKAGRLSVHHIRPLGNGGSQYDPENLQAICKTCHVFAHSTCKSASRKRGLMFALEALL